MALKPITSILVGALLLIAAIFFVGIYRDPEFYSDISTFIKYKPTLQFEFVSHEEGDNHNPTIEMQQETKRYYDFLEHRPFDFSPLLLQAILTFFVLGLVSWNALGSLPVGKVLLHYICSFLLTSIGLGYAFYYYDTRWVLFISIVTVAINYCLAILLTRKLYTQQHLQTHD